VRHFRRVIELTENEDLKTEAGAAVRRLQGA